MNAIKRRMSSMSGMGLANQFSQFINNSNENNETYKQPEVIDPKLLEYKQMFDVFDADGNGSIDMTELATAMKKFGFNSTQKELADIIYEVDADGNGEIDFEEFCEVIRKLKIVSLSWTEVVQQCFVIFDKSQSGNVHREDFVKILHEVGHIHDDLANELFDQYDVDNNGTINYNEFYDFVREYLTEDDL